jgi:diphosphomevalonate decarboxylase
MEKITQFIARPLTITNTFKGSCHWEAPSNIALVKYWGKKENQIPANPSISFTLSNCVTRTQMSYEFANKMSFIVSVDGVRNEKFEPKITTFLERIVPYCPFLNQLHLTIDTTNTFPHSSGIASSASGMAALSLCICDIEKQLNPQFTELEFTEKASFLARLGSGSACRSVFPTLASWGRHDDITKSSDSIATPFNDAHPIFSNFQDTILLVDKGQKEVGSTEGHNLMFGHPFAEKRFEQAHTNLSNLLVALKSGDLKTFTEIVESEALTLHAMMMTSMPYFILMKPNTLQIIEKVWAYRKATNLHPIITLDAGANVHLLYPFNEKDTILEFIKNELAPLCQNHSYICDQVGNGPKKIA